MAAQSHAQVDLGKVNYVIVKGKESRFGFSKPFFQQGPLAANFWLLDEAGDLINGYLGLGLSLDVITAGPFTFALTGGISSDLREMMTTTNYRQVEWGFGLQIKIKPRYGPVRFR